MPESREGFGVLVCVWESGGLVLGCPVPFQVWGRKHQFNGSFHPKVTNAGLPSSKPGPPPWSGQSSACQCCSQEPPGPLRAEHSQQHSPGWVHASRASSNMQFSESEWLPQPRVNLSVFLILCETSKAQRPDSKDWGRMPFRDQLCMPSFPISYPEQDCVLFLKASVQDLL